MKREKIIDELLCYMRDEVVAAGSNINTTHFDFLFDDNNKGNNDLINLRKKVKVDDEMIKSILRECVTDDYINRFSGSEEFKFLSITDKGMARAKSVQLSSPKRECIKIILYHPLFNTIVSGIISFALGFYFGDRQ